MELHVFFDKPVKEQFGGVVLKAMRKYGADEDKINALSVEERLELLSEKLNEDGYWREWLQKNASPHASLRYQDLPFLPDGIFYDCGLERISFGTNAGALHVAAEKAIGGKSGGKESALHGHFVSPSRNPEISNREFYSDCSVCGFSKIIEMEECPHCGAKMDSES